MSVYCVCALLLDLGSVFSGSQLWLRSWKWPYGAGDQIQAREAFLSHSHLPPRLRVVFGYVPVGDLQAGLWGGRESASQRVGPDGRASGEITGSTVSFRSGVSVCTFSHSTVLGKCTLHWKQG